MADAQGRTLPPRARAAVFALYRVAWCCLLAFAIVAQTGGIYYQFERADTVWRPFERVGLDYEVLGGVHGVFTPFSEEAKRSGLRDGDRVVAIDGRPTSDLAADMADLATRLDGPEGTSVRIAALSPDGTLREHRLTRTRAHVDAYYAGSGITPEIRFWLLVIGASVPNYLLIASAALLFRRRPRDLVAALLSLSFLGLAATILGTAAFHAAFGIYRLQDLLATASTAGFVTVLTIFPDGRFAARWLRWMVPLPIAWAVQSYFFLLPLALDMFAMLALLLIGVGSLAFRYRRLPPGGQRQQIRWTLFGFATGLAALTVANFLQIVQRMDVSPAAEIWSLVASVLIGSLASALFALGLLVSLLRYRLYDADTVISRSAGYAVMTLGLVAVFTASERVIEILSERYFEGDLGALSGGIAAGLAAVAIAPMHNRIQDWAERRFQKGLLHMRRELPLVVGDLRETAAMDELLGEVLARLERGVRAVRGAVLIGGKAAALRNASAAEAKSDLLFPMRIPLTVDHAGTAPFGWILLGPRPDGSFYGKDEREALAAIADPVARAIRIVQLRERRDAKANRDRKALLLRIEALEAKLA